MSVIEVKVPDIGDFDAVEVIEVLVKAGDTVEEEQSLIVLESDKASMEVPSSAAGKVVDVKVKVGDKVAKGTLICTVEGGAAAAPAPARRRRPSPRLRLLRRRQRLRRPPRMPAAPTSSATCSCWARPRRLLGRLPLGRPRHEHGAGRALRHPGRRLPERGLHPVEGAAAQRGRDRRGQGAGRARHPVRRSQDRPRRPAALQGKRGRQADRRSAGMAKARKVQVVRGIGTFLDPHHLEVQETEGDSKATNGKKTVIRFERRSSRPAARP
jgi:dihydrolipoamide dehydrogenase